ncbi:MAG TPA: glycine zipper 2TM domain-containing protein [Casimicrobiaceae bacterium]|nr:glycine zipper 2TM domain-containing protein [Casimicrobiaceae bacterium]
MRHRLLMVSVVAMSASAMAADVDVSIRVGQPNFYGRIDVGDVARPQVVYAQPIIAQPPPSGVVVQPIYLRVPPGHAKHWNKHCQRYNACGQPVYFVQERWYNNVYAPRYRVAAEPAPPSPAYVFQAQPSERVFVVPVTAVRAVVGPPEQRCWVERQQVIEERSDAPNVPGAIAGAVIGGVLGHQIGGGRGKDVATVGGAAAGAVIGANVGRGGTRVRDEDVQRCAAVERPGKAAYWDVSYRFRGVTHRAQLTSPPGATITVDARGQPQV